MVIVLHRVKVLWAVFLIALLFLSGCAVKELPPEAAVEKPIPEAAVKKPPPGSVKEAPSVAKYDALVRLGENECPQFFDSSSMESLRHSLRQSLLYFNRVPDSRRFQFGPDSYDARHMRRSIKALLDFIESDPGKEALGHFVRKRYAVYGSPGNRGEGVLFTGYYEPSLDASLTRDKEYRYPLFSDPEDLLTINLAAFSDRYKDLPKLSARVNKKNQVVPYFTRKEINAIPDFGKRAKPLAWVRDRTDRFFLEIQGSGRLFLKQGGEMNVHYSTKNGHPYRAIGGYLISKGEISREEMSMQAIRAWLDKNPSRQDEVFNYNPSFVFFRQEKGGPFGNISVEVTPLRSVATDSKLFPKGALCFIETEVPSSERVDRPVAFKPFSGFVMNQDTGGAIKGVSRCDLFHGNGKDAEFAAGHMKQRGRLYFLVLKP